MTADLTRKGDGARGGVALVAALHLLHWRPDRHEKLVEGGLIQFQTSGRDARARLRDDISGNISELGWLVKRELRRKVEGDVAGEQAAPHEGVLPRVELAADGLVIGVK